MQWNPIGIVFCETFLLLFYSHIKCDKNVKIVYNLGSGVCHFNLPGVKTSDSKPEVALVSCELQVESADRETWIRPVVGSSLYNWE